MILFDENKINVNYIQYLGDIYMHAICTFLDLFYMDMLLTLDS